MEGHQRNHIGILDIDDQARKFIFIELMVTILDGEGYYNDRKKTSLDINTLYLIIMYGYEAAT